MLPVSVVNRRLVEMGVNPLTNLVDGYDENGVKIEDRSSAGQVRTHENRWVGDHLAVFDSK